MPSAEARRLARDFATWIVANEQVPATMKFRDELARRHEPLAEEVVRAGRKLGLGHEQMAAHLVARELARPARPLRAFAILLGSCA